MGIKKRGTIFKEAMGVGYSVALPALLNPFQQILEKRGKKLKRMRREKKMPHSLNLIFKIIKNKVQ